MQKRSRWISILVIIMGTGLLWWNAIREQEEQAERRRAAEIRDTMEAAEIPDTMEGKTWE